MSAPAPRRAESLRPDLRHAWLDGVLYSAMVGVGETYLPAFVLAAGHGELASGLVATLPMLTGATLQLVTPRAVARLGSHRRWVSLCASLQALAFLPLIVGALSGGMAPLSIFLAAAAYWAAGLAAAPAWNTWITTIVPRRVWSHYFALRTRACHAATLAGLVGGGVLLQYGAGSALDSTGTRVFALLFLAAGAARWASARHLAAQSEPEPLPAGFRPLPWREVLRSRSLAGARRLIVYMLALQVAVQVAAPFYSPYMLGELRMPYATYMLLIAAAFVSKMLALPLLGAWARRAGPRRLAWIGGTGVVFASLPWFATTSVPLLLVTQIVAGAFWAAYELATFLLLFEHIPESERTSVMTLYNLFNSAAFALGSLAGGALLETLGLGARAYATLFLVSSGLRAATLLLLRRVGDGGGARPGPGATPQLGASALRPSLGSIDRPLVPAEVPERG